jgi:hypothetical protein
MTINSKLAMIAPSVTLSVASPALAQRAFTVGKESDSVRAGYSREDPLKRARTKSFGRIVHRLRRFAHNSLILIRRRRANVPDVTSNGVRNVLTHEESTTRFYLTQDSALFVIGNCLKAANYHAARGARRDFDFWSAKADEIADIYRKQS